MNPDPHAPDDETIDGILDGGLRIIQRRRGYRFSLDALLLASFVDLGEGDELLELGTGSGIIALLLARRSGCRRVVGIELQEGLALQAARNVVLNGLEERVEIRRGDVRHPQGLCDPQSFSVVVFNPPYRRKSSGRMNPDPEKALARHEITATIGDFLHAAAHALRPGGRVFLIYPLLRMAELVARMREWRIEPKRMRLVHSRAAGRGEFALVEGVKGGKEGLAVLPPLFIYREAGGYTAEMERVFGSLSAVPARDAG